MPGTLLHLTFAQLVYPSLNVNKLNFMAGNLIPDETADKTTAHYRESYKNTPFLVVNIENAKKDLLKNPTAMTLGMYCHLYLDHHFIKNFLIPSLEWDYEKGMVSNPRNNKSWTIEQLTSKTGFHSSYSEINSLLIKNNCVDMNIVETLPEILPNTGLAIFDARRKKTWKEELNGYLSEKVEYTGDILEYDRVWTFLEKMAKQFIKEIN